MTNVARPWLSVPLAFMFAACAAPTPSATTAAPAPTPTTVLRQIIVACDDPYPGQCLQLVAFGVANLPAGHMAVAAVTVTAMDYPCDGTAACTQPPHRGDTWVAFALRNGQRLGMWVVDVMGMKSIQKAGSDLAPAASVAVATSSYPLVCGLVPDDICTGAAAGGVMDNTTPSSVQVDPTDVAGQYRVTFRYAGGSNADVDVARDATSEIGWSAVRPGSTP
jgi:hypothetical protein